MSKGIFGNMFDFNGDGNLDFFEQAAEFSFLQKTMEDAEKEVWISAIPDHISALAQEYFIEPGDYDSYEDFIEAVKDELG